MVMPTQEVRLITVSREFGAGASDIAAELGARLSWPVLDHDIVPRVATRLRMDEGTIEKYDEHPPSLLARIAMVLIVPPPEAPSFPTPVDLPSHDAIAEATRVEIEAAGKTPPLVVVGHGAQCIFEGRADTLHVRIVAPFSSRQARVANRLKVDLAAAATMVHRADQDRQTYVHRYFHRDWRDSLLYDLQLNTGTVAIDEAVDLIANLVRLRAAAPRPVEPQAS